MELKELQKNWDELGRQDPLWAILTVPEYRYGKWDPAEFFKRGEAEIDEIMHYVAALGRAVRRRRALDFGCGIGRVTQALCRHFDECCGVDIAPSMIDLARWHNRYGDRCRYFLNESAHLGLFEDSVFDFIYSVIVLQHIPPKYSQAYIREFVRVLAPEGLLIFQIPSELAPDYAPPPPQPTQRAGLAARLYRRMRASLSRRTPRAETASAPEPKMEMHSVRQDVVLALITQAGGKVIDIRRDGWAGPAWVSFRYCVTK
jgi:SAM-dependent methyltransferase